jgi:glycosyltransferase involved in cell wall biosynthesis
MSEKKIKVLAYCDSPTCATGFGTVSRNIFEGLYNTDRYDIDILGINYWGDPHDYPFRVWPTGTNGERDPYGRKKVCSMIPNMEYDILFFLQDTFILDFLPELINHLKGTNKNFKSICYFPVDGAPKEQWIKNVNLVDYLVSYSEFGKREAKKAYEDVQNMSVIPHGVNVSDYYPINNSQVDAFRKQYFGESYKNFIFTNLNRNQQRKDIPRTIQAFSEFKKIVPNSSLYLHMAKKDQGWDLESVCKSYGLNATNEVIFPGNFGPNQGYPREVVNMIYNVSDCVISTSLGEGWGLSWVEAMATKTPVIMPGNTAMLENITEDKGYLVDSGTNPSLFTVIPNDNEVVRPLVDVDDMVEKMLDVYNNRDKAKEKAENAYKWVTSDLDWQKSVVPLWVDLFDKAYASFKDGVAEAGSRENTIVAEEF